MVPRADQKACGSRGRVVDGLADAGIDQPDQGADHMARGTELTKLACLFDLAQHVLEQIALRIGVHPVEVQIVQLTDNLGEHGRLVDYQPGAIHEVGNAVGREFAMEREYLFADPVHQTLAVQRRCPGRPAQTFARRRLHSRSAGVARVAQRPFAFEYTGVGVRAGPFRRTHPRGVGCLVHIEIDEEAELLGILRRIGIAAAEQVVADVVDAAPEFGCHGHGATAARRARLTAGTDRIPPC